MKKAPAEAPVPITVLPAAYSPAKGGSRCRVVFNFQKKNLKKVCFPFFAPFCLLTNVLSLPWYASVCLASRCCYKNKILAGDCSQFGE
jgi:hypothetical protein